MKGQIPIGVRSEKSIEVAESEGMLFRWRLRNIHFGERQQEMQAKEVDDDAKKTDGDSSLVGWTNSSRICILCLPARDEADEIAAMMLAQLLAMRGCLVQAVSI